jgi:hypothetical protein
MEDAGRAISEASMSAQHDDDDIDAVTILKKALRVEISRVSPSPRTIVLLTNALVRWLPPPRPSSSQEVEPNSGEIYEVDLGD